MASGRIVKEIREPQTGFTKPDAMLTRVIPNFIDYCNIDQFKETSNIKLEGVTIFGYDQRRKFTKSTWLNSEDRNESEDKFLATLDKSDKQKVVENKSIRLDIQKSTGENKVNLQIQYDGVLYALITVPTGYKFGKTKLKELLKDSFKQQVKIEIVFE
ncbi:unnamed protein product [Rotaria socialis]|uniref:Uncharacterized protein n=2 Tax=Rotaria socialis TaxID=392032 RepID=A0A821HQ76_9BILA|nr:unnamed protein product [Rotaria socialis]CAF3315582.1 unnamed protein product [Rotaria socialis]CAF3457182.1 unnamed protein product [Rotaria socialis]CAF3709300.1 unnamed protein product [Rotaria socialis]CAF4473731.1 unnamed protein product [Rotaria socialis]